MRPFFFGPQDRRLFGILTPPTQGAPSAGVVICPPLGKEAIRAHRSMKLLADRISQTGSGVLRFDYFGTGDSLGTQEEGMPSGWIGDIQTAAQEVRDQLAVSRVILVGLRLGGFLAVASETRAVSELILWDPIPHMGSYVDGLIAEAERPEGSPFWELAGFSFSDEFLDELRALTLDGVRRVPRDVRVVVSEENPGLPELLRQLEDRKARVDTVEVDAPAAWVHLEDLGAGAVPIATLSQITEWIH